MKTFHIIVFFITIAIPISIINFNAYLKGSMPNISQALLTMAFILLWFLCTFFIDNKNIGIKASTWFWGCGMLLLIIAYMVDFNIISILAIFLFAGPLYGLRYFIEMPSNMYFAFLCIAISYGFSVIGWLLSKLKGRWTN